MTTAPPSLQKNLTPERVTERIASCESPQDILTDLATMTQTEPFTLAQLNLPLEILIENGARIATKEPGCAFEVMIRNSGTAQSLVFSNAMTALMEKPGEIPLLISVAPRRTGCGHPTG